MVSEIILDKTNTGNKPPLLHGAHSLCWETYYCPGIQAHMELQKMRLKYKGEEDYTNC